MKKSLFTEYMGQIALIAAILLIIIPLSSQTIVGVQPIGSKITPIEIQENGFDAYTVPAQKVLVINGISIPRSANDPSFPTVGQFPYVEIDIDGPLGPLPRLRRATIDMTVVGSTAVAIAPIRVPSGATVTVADDDGLTEEAIAHGFLIDL